MRVRLIRCKLVVDPHRTAPHLQVLRFPSLQPLPACTSVLRDMVQVEVPGRQAPNPNFALLCCAHCSTCRVVQREARCKNDANCQTAQKAVGSQGPERSGQVQSDQEQKRVQYLAGRIGSICRTATIQQGEPSPTRIFTSSLASSLVSWQDCSACSYAELAAMSAPQQQAPPAPAPPAAAPAVAVSWSLRINTFTPACDSIPRIQEVESAVPEVVEDMTLILSRLRSSYLRELVDE